MKQFLKKIFIAAALCAILPLLYTVAFFAFASDEMTLSYVAAIADKVDRLASIDDSKIILVGNSNVAFGIDSETIEEAYGMPVVNMGLHGSLGNNLIEQIAKSYIREGDIVVIAHSDYSGKDLNDPTLCYEMMVSNEYVKTVIMENYREDVIKTLPTYMWETSLMLLMGKTLYSDEYARSSFNKYGDVAYQRNESLVEFSEDSARSFDISEDEVTRINEYNAYCESVGATLVIAGYPIGDGEFTTSIEEIQSFQVTLAELMDCQVISDYTDYLIGYEYFYNSTLHLTDEGAAIRTAQLIDDLRMVISE